MSNKIDNFQKEHLKELGNVNFINPLEFKEPRTLNADQNKKIQELNQKISTYNNNGKIDPQEFKKILYASYKIIESLTKEKSKTKIKTSKYKKFNPDTQIWLPVAYLNYGMWYDFLRAAELSEDYQVDWKLYKDWGGKKVVMNTWFKTWFASRGEELFGSKEKGGLGKFKINTNSPKPYAYARRLKDWRRFEKEPHRFNKSDRQILKAREHLENVSKGLFP